MVACDWLGSLPLSPFTAELDQTSSVYFNSLSSTTSNATTMTDPERITSRFFGYPAPKEGPNVPLVRKEDKNPVFRGWLLVVCAWL
jgi:hypothetical protein